MAAVRLKYIFFCNFILLCALLVITAKSNNDFIENGIDNPIITIEYLKPEDEIISTRSKRYVESAIPRLSDNYYKQDSYHSKGLDKDDIDSFSRKRGRMEMLGNMAINVDDLAFGGTHHISETKKEEPVTEIMQEKSTKKPTGTVIKKNQETNQGKSSLPVNPDTNHDQSSTTQSSFNVSSSTLITTTPTTNHDTIPQVSDHQQHGDEVTSQADYAGDGGNETFPDADFPKAISNNTLIKNNITHKQVDQHTYYNSTFIVDPGSAKEYWIDMDHEKDVIVNKMLSNNHRRAVTVKLSFDFPFYGHLIQKVTIATGGFLYTGDYIHSWLASTQYIAPLMANFDTGLSDESQVRYSDNGTSFTVEWYRVHLQDKQDAGSFTFQVTLHKNGDIVFVYKDIPILVEDIQDRDHPVKVGLSDAYIMDRTVFFIRRKTIYEYHRVNIKKQYIKNWTAIYLTALPTCLFYTDCNSCVISTGTMFLCKWCPAVNRCSSGFDRHRQDWQLKQCDHVAINNTDSCKAINISAMLDRPHEQGRLVDGNNNEGSNSEVSSHTATDPNMEKSSQPSNFGHSGLISLIFFILTISVIGLWTLYAYRNPHTTSGQVLIKYRPSQWSLRRGEARYTAATIHM